MYSKIFVYYLYRISKLIFLGSSIVLPCFTGQLIIRVSYLAKIVIISLLRIAVEEKLLGFKGHIAIAQYYILLSYRCFSISFIGYILTIHLQSIALLEHHIAVSYHLITLFVQDRQVAPNL